MSIDIDEWDKILTATGCDPMKIATALRDKYGAAYVKELEAFLVTRTMRAFGVAREYREQFNVWHECAALEAALTLQGETP